MNKAQLTAATVVHDPTHAVVTNGSPAPLGTKVHDLETTRVAWLGSRSRRRRSCSTRATTARVRARRWRPGGRGTGTRSVDTGSLAAGDYSFKASLADNSNYLGDDSDCEPFKVAKAQLTAATVVHDPTHTVVTNGSPAALGMKVHDLETTRGGVAGFAEPAPTFLLYTSNDCTGSGAAVATGAAEGTGTRSVDTGSLAAGDYSFKASLADNSNYLGDDSDCEPFKVAKAQLTAATVVHDPTHTVVTNGSPAPVGDEGARSGDDQGWRGWVRGAGADVPALHEQRLHGFGRGGGDRGGRGHGDALGRHGLAGGRRLLVQGQPGRQQQLPRRRLRLRAVQGREGAADGGDGRARPDAYGGDERVAGAVGDEGARSGDDQGWRGWVRGAGADVPALHEQRLHGFGRGGGDRGGRGHGTRSVDTGSLAAGDYSFKASLADNSNYLGDDSDCEPFKVAKAQLTAATVVHDPTHTVVTNGSPAPLGTKVHDLETTRGGVAGFAEPAPTFLLYTSNDCTGSGAAVATGRPRARDALGRHGLAGGRRLLVQGQPGRQQQLPRRRLRLRAVQGREGAADGGDGGARPDAYGGDERVAGAVGDEGARSGDDQGWRGWVRGAGATFLLYTSNDCTGSGAAVATGAAEGTGTRSVDTGSLAAGDYSFKASLADNSNYLGDDSDCEPFKVAKAQLTAATVVHDPTHAVVTNGSPAAFGTKVHDLETTRVAWLGPGAGADVPALHEQRLHGFGRGGGDRGGRGHGTRSVDTGSLAAGDYSFKASLADNSNYLGDDSDCEPFKVAKAQLTAATVVHDPTHTVVTNGSPAPLGTKVHDLETTRGGVAGFAEPARQPCSTRATTARVRARRWRPGRPRARDALGRHGLAGGRRLLVQGQPGRQQQLPRRRLRLRAVQGREGAADGGDGRA